VIDYERHEQLPEHNRNQRRRGSNAWNKKDQGSHDSDTQCTTKVQMPFAWPGQDLESSRAGKYRDNGQKQANGNSCQHKDRTKAPNPLTECSVKHSLHSDHSASKNSQSKI
jgi:hypothetical protein